MSHSGSEVRVTEYGRSKPGRRRASRRAFRQGPSRGPGLMRLLILLLVVAGLVFAFVKVKDFLSGPDDYSGAGTGKIVIEVPAGANGQQIADVLKSKDVVKSAEAFYQESLNDPRAQSIQPGFYQLRKQMSAKAALLALLDKKNRVEGRVVVPEGARLDQVAKIIAQGSEISEQDVAAALKKPKALGLPKQADSTPRATCFPPRTSPSPARRPPTCSGRWSPRRSKSPSPSTSTPGPPRSG